MKLNDRIRDWLRDPANGGVIGVKDCYIAHVKELNGIPVPRAWNRQGDERLVKCPPSKKAPIEKALRHFGVL